MLLLWSKTPDTDDNNFGAGHAKLSRTSGSALISVIKGFALKVRNVVGPGQYHLR